MANPKLTISLLGDINNFINTYTWTPSEQIEKTLSVIDTDGDVSITFSDIDNVEFIIFQSDSTFTVKITAGGITDTKEVESIYLFNPSSTYMSSITAISISTSSTTAQLINYRIYGA